MGIYERLYDGAMGDPCRTSARELEMTPQLLMTAVAGLVSIICFIGVLVQREDPRASYLSAQRRA